MQTATLDVSQLTLTSDQEDALKAFYMMLSDPCQNVFVLRGYSGCGKSTLVHTILDRLNGYLQAAKLIFPSMIQYAPMLTATTNKAAENLAQITGHDVRTIHSALGLRVSTDFKTNVTTLIPRTMAPLENLLLLIDEASYMDEELIKFTFERTKNCKIIFIGDPAQLTPVLMRSAPVFNKGYPGAALTQVVRQAEGNPIIDLSTKFRETVNTGKFFSFKPDGYHVQRLHPDDFVKAIETKFTRPDWKYQDSKVLAWTNKRVVAFNQHIRNLTQGDPNFQVGDYAVCNSYIQIGKNSLKTDQLVLITTIEPEQEIYGVKGKFMTVDGHFRAFQPNSLADQKEALKMARAKNEMNACINIETTWIDLRGAFACTVNKAQGSTFGSVFIDLNDIARCDSGDQIARMLYVAVSRARNQVFLTGDLA